MTVLRKMNWNELKHEYDLDGSRLLPWEGLQSPFGGAWCIVRAGTTSRLHAHDEFEMFIAIEGTAQIKVGNDIYMASKGDLIRIPLDFEHHVINNSNQDFHFYSIWWSQDSASKFLAEMKV
ncbi:cupin domain-containing protein [Xenorhabdus siamensis]|uniref:cupin domain-containing protein n=1 Tax=Xenorhabdus siamensis TaxID=3136254 RepID=UPI0030F38ADA